MHILFSIDSLQQGGAEQSIAHIIRHFSADTSVTILYFYPKDSTPTCTLESCNLRDNYKPLAKAGFEVIGVSADDVKSHEKFATKQSLPFSLIADTDRELIEAYEAWGEKSMYGKKYMGIIRKTFVIDEKGKIAAIIEKVDAKNHAKQILDALQNG